MYKCYDCGHIFSEDEVVHWKESRGEYFGFPCSEDMTGCPNCHGEYGDAKECLSCGEYFLSDEMTQGYCEECAKEKLEEYSFGHITELYLISSDETESVQLNQFISSMFSPSQINELLLRELLESDKIKKVDCSSFVKCDESWILDKIAKREEE